MVFNLKTTIMLNKVFTVEAEHLKDAMKMVEKQVMEDIDLNSLEIDSISYDMTDPTIREYNRQWCAKRVK